MRDFEAWVQARSPQFVRAAYLLTEDVQLAEDLLQDTLARVASRWESLTRTGSVDAYARKVMYHLSVDWWRRRRSRPELVLDRPRELVSPTDGEGYRSTRCRSPREGGLEQCSEHRLAAGATQGRLHVLGCHASR